MYKISIKDDYKINKGLLMKNADIELIKKEISNCWNHHNDGKTLPKDTKKYVDQTLSLLDNGFIRI